MAPGQHQAIMWINAGWDIVNLTLGTNFSEILSEIQISYKENAFENVV